MMQEIDPDVVYRCSEALAKAMRGLRMEVVKEIADTDGPRDWTPMMILTEAVLKEYLYPGMP